MKLTDRELREVIQRGTARAGSRDACPSADELVRAALGELGGEQRARLADHLIGCSDCSREIQLLSADDAEPAPLRPAPGSTATWRGVAALAAGLLLVMSLAWWLWPKST